MLALLAGLVWACALAIPSGHADDGRFVPWKEAKALPLALRDLAGLPHTLADYHGKVVLVNFWATWCAPCREEMPSMERLRRQFAGRPFAILAVNYGESDARATDFVILGHAVEVQGFCPGCKDGAARRTHYQSGTHSH